MAQQARWSVQCDAVSRCWGRGGLDLAALFCVASYDVAILSYRVRVVKPGEWNLGMASTRRGSERLDVRQTVLFRLPQIPGALHADPHFRGGIEPDG